MSDLSSLIAQLEATGPSKALNRQIARVVGWHRVEPRHGGGKYGGWIAPDDFMGVGSDGSPILDSLHGTTIHRDPPDFTGSIDVALSLVPEGFPWSVSSDWRSNSRGNVCTIDPSGKYIAETIDTKSTPTTPAVALCIAALKARAE